MDHERSKRRRIAWMGEIEAWIGPHECYGGPGTASLGSRGGADRHGPSP
jgi:hypothetical protein